MSFTGIDGNKVENLKLDSLAAINQAEMSMLKQRGGSNEALLVESTLVHKIATSLLKNPQATVDLDEVIKQHNFALAEYPEFYKEVKTRSQFSAADIPVMASLSKSWLDLVTPDFIASAAPERLDYVFSSALQNPFNLTGHYTDAKGANKSMIINSFAELFAKGETTKFTSVTLNNLVDNGTGTGFAGPLAAAASADSNLKEIVLGLAERLTSSRVSIAPIMRNLNSATMEILGNSSVLKLAVNPNSGLIMPLMSRLGIPDDVFSQRLSLVGSFDSPSN